MDAMRHLDLAYARFNAARTLRYAAPSAFRVERFGPLYATFDPARADEPYYNRIVGLAPGPDAIAALTDALRRYDDAGLAPRVDLEPANTTPGVTGLLIDRGFRPESSLTWLAGAPSALAAPGVSPPPAGAGPPVTRVTRWTHDSADRFLDLLEAGGAPFAPAIRADRREHYCTERFRAFVAEIDGTPVAWATLFVHDGAGLLGNAGTLAPHRGRGCHTALLRARTADAARLGLQRVYSDVEHATTSHRNNERAGLRVVTVQTLWSRP